MQGIARVEKVVVLDELFAQPLAALHEGAESTRAAHVSVQIRYPRMLQALVM
jgi:hypothetical protein